MEILATPLEGVLHIIPDVFRDERGLFVESWQQERYTQAGIAGPFVQDNHSSSRKGVLRGIHFQRLRPQGKLISISLGKVYDVAVDVRLHSPTFGQWYAAELSAENQHQLWIAPGLAHGFLVLSDVAHFHYKCTDFYVPGDEYSLRWDDPDLHISWPLAEAGVLAPTLSAKDSAAPSLREIQATLAT